MTNVNLTNTKQAHQHGDIFQLLDWQLKWRIGYSPHHQWEYILVHALSRVIWKDVQPEIVIKWA